VHVTVTDVGAAARVPGMHRVCVCCSGHLRRCRTSGANRVESSTTVTCVADEAAF
jgi:hypothetical protein